MGEVNSRKNDWPRPYFILGLILIGLFAGVLGTLWTIRLTNSEFSRPEYVETVHLGDADDDFSGNASDCFVSSLVIYLS